MASRRLQRRVSFSKKKKKLHILQSLTNSKSVGSSSIIMDAFMYIHRLKIQLEELTREYFHLLNIIQVLYSSPYLSFALRCKKIEDLLVSILEAFEEMDISVVEARVSCNYFFAMEAIVEADEDQQGLIAEAKFTIGSLYRPPLIFTRKLRSPLLGIANFGACPFKYLAKKYVAPARRLKTN
nr:uncharacterized protein LOC109192567 [Ipomoea trifida]